MIVARRMAQALPAGSASSGAWPKTLNSLTAANFATKPANAAEAKARRWQLGEKYYFLEAGDVVEVLVEDADAHDLFGVIAES